MCSNCGYDECTCKKKKETPREVNKLKRRQGKFLISKIFLDNHPKEVQKIMSKVIVVKCEYLFHADAFEYHALSEDFEEVEIGYIAPMNNVIVKNGFIVFEKEKWGV